MKPQKAFTTILQVTMHFTLVWILLTGTLKAQNFSYKIAIGGGCIKPLCSSIFHDSRFFFRSIPKITFSSVVETGISSGSGNPDNSVERGGEQKCNTWFIAVIILLGLVALFVALFVTRRNRLMHERVEYERRLAELQFKSLRNQLAPHFVFNALNAIGSSIYQDDREKSYDFLQKFSTLIRSTLVHADKTYRALNEEIEFVRNYLALEQFRFENKFEYEFRIEEGINTNIPVPKMIIQTFAENAVKHGLVQKAGKGLLTIMLNVENDYLKISIEDDGIGRTESGKRNSDSTGKGLEIITEFITLFNKFNEKKIHFELTDIITGSGTVSGTRAIIKLPVDFTYNSIHRT
jgi:hypothetical protein